MNRTTLNAQLAAIMIGTEIKGLMNEILESAPINRLGILTSLEEMAVDQYWDCPRASDYWAHVLPEGGDQGLTESITLLATLERTQGIPERDDRDVRDDPVYQYLLWDCSRWASCLAIDNQMSALIARNSSGGPSQ